MLMVRRLAVSLAFAASFAAEDAFAIDSTVTQSGGSIFWTGNSGEDDVAVFTHDSASVLTIEDPGGIALGGPVPPDCVDNANVVTCTVAGGVTSLFATARSGNDTLTVTGSMPLSTTLTGDDGNDTITGGAGNDSIDYGGGPGADIIDGRGGDDSIGFHGNGDVVSDTGSGGFDTLLFDLFATGATIRVDNGIADDGETGVGLGEVKAGFEQFIGGPQADHVFGSAAAERFRGNGGNDELVGGAGVDTFSGGEGDDTLTLTDGVADGATACGNGNDTALLDATGDTADGDCETVTHAAGGEGGGGGGGDGGGGGTTTTPTTTTPTTPPPADEALPGGCPQTADMFLRDDYDVDRALDGDMDIQVSVPRGGVEVVTALTRGETGRTNEPLGPTTSSSSPTAGVQTVRLRIDPANAAMLRGKSTPVVVNVFLIVEGCPTVQIADYVQLAPNVDNKGVTAAPSRASSRYTLIVIDRRTKKCDPHNIFTYQECPAAQPVPDSTCKQSVPLSQVISYFGKCIEQPDPKKRPTYYRSKVLVQMNGLYLEPTNGESEIWWDTKDLQMGIKGKAKVYFKVKLPNGTTKDVVLWDGAAGTSFSLYGNELLTLRKDIKGDVLGFPIGADLALNFIKDGFITRPTLTLPPQFGGVQASVRMTVPYSGEVDVSELTLVVPVLNAYGFKILNSQLSWEKQADSVTKVVTESWFGRSTVQFPAMGGAGAGPEFGISMRWQDGKFASGSVIATGLRQVFGNPLIALEEVSGQLTLGDPLVVRLQGRVAFGPKLGPDTPPELANLEGTLTYTGPVKGPGTWEANGNFELWQLPAGLGGASASGKVTYTTDGKFTWSAYAQARLGAAGVAGTVDGSVAGPDWEVRGVVDIALGGVTGRGELHGNNKGIVGCVSTVAISYGFTFDWAKRKLDPMQKCGLAEWQKILFDKAPRQAGAEGFTILPNRSRMAVALTSAQPPALVSPSGLVVRPAFSLAEDGTSYYSVTKPENGRWTIQATTPVSNARVAYAGASVDVSAKMKPLSGGPRFRVDYDAPKLPAGLRLDFYEQLPGGYRDLVKSNQDGKGSFSFRPVDAGNSSRKRRLLAVVTQGGVPTGVEEEAARFVTGPAELPDAPRPVVDHRVNGELVYFLFSRRKGDIVISWGDAEGAKGYEVDVRRQDGRRRVVLTGKRQFVLENYENDEDFSIKVRGYNEDNEYGPARSYARKLKDDKVKKQTQKRIPDPASVGYVEVGVG